MPEIRFAGIAQPYLDHIVILVDHRTLADIDKRLEGIFTVAPGGQHTDGLTWNRLILFPDGVYIELVAFFDTLDSEARKKHRWGSLQEGDIIDWACTLPHGKGFHWVHERVEQRLTGYVYNDQVLGGRETPEGTVLKWVTRTATNPDGTPTYPGTLPIWCLENSISRRLRVPYDSSPELASHPCGVRGVLHLVIENPQGDFTSLNAVYNAIYKVDGITNDPNGWNFRSYGRLDDAWRTISIKSGSGPQVIHIVLEGGSNSPSSVELLPALVIKIEPPGPTIVP